MSTSALRQQLHNYLEVAEEKKIKAIYTMMEENIKELTVNYSDEFKDELNRRYSSYKKGETKTFTRTESKKRISKILKAGR